MKSQRRFAPKGGRIESESVAELAGISNKEGKAGLFRKKPIARNHPRSLTHVVAAMSPRLDLGCGGVRFPGRTFTSNH